MKVKVIAVLVVLIVLTGGIVFYWKATGPVVEQVSDTTQNTGSETTSQVASLPPQGSSIGAEASVIASDLISAAAVEANAYSADDENFLLDDTGDIELLGQAITIE